MNRLTAGLAAGVALTVLSAGISSAEAVTLRFSDYGPNRGTRAAAMEWFADQIKERSGGSMDVEFFWGGSLLGGKDTLKGVGDGVADMGTIVGFFTPRELRTYNIGDLPFENSDMWVGLRAMHDLARENEALGKEFADANVVYVTNYTTGPVQLICTKPVKTLDDLKGLKVRASGPYGDALAELGAEVVRMSQSEVYQALDSGLIDCNQNYYYSMKGYKQYEVAPHVLEMDWGQNMAFGIVMNKFAYDGLSDEEKKVLADVAADFEDHLAQLMMEEQAKVKAEMQAGIDGKSIAVVELPADGKKRLMDMSGKQIDKWSREASQDGLDAEAIIADYRDRIAAYRKELDARGYPWTR